MKYIHKESLYRRDNLVMNQVVYVPYISEIFFNILKMVPEI